MQGMGNLSASRLYGDDYQHLFSWIKILDLLDPNTPLSHIWVENPSAAAADDLTIHPKDPQVHQTQYFQIKGHRDLSKSYSMEELATPSDSGSKSLLLSLWDSWQKIKTGTTFGHMEIWLVSDWQADNYLGKYIREERFTDDFLNQSSNGRTKVGKRCKKWKEHLNTTDDQEFLDFCQTLRFRLGYLSSPLWELAQAKMQAYGLKYEDEYVWNGIGVVRKWIREGRPRKVKPQQLLATINQGNLALQLEHPILTIEQKFTQKTSYALKHIHRDIPGIGVIPRQEIQSIEAHFNQKNHVLLIGDAGSGKSGIAACLADSAIAAEKLVLFLDARSISKMSNQSELESYFSLNCELESAINQVADYKSCRIIIDQLDNVIGSTTENILVDLALSCTNLANVEIIVITRRNTNHLINIQVKRLVEAGFVEQSSKPLDRIVVRDALTKLGVTEPSDNLVEMAENLLNLEIIGLIKQQNPHLSDFSRITNSISLWELYLGTLVNREAVGRGSEYAVNIVVEATKLAHESLIKGEMELILGNIINEHRRRLIDSVLIHLSGRIYRFRHEELQYFLYAKEASEENKMPSSVFEEIGHLAKNVLPWMKDLYLQMSQDSEYSNDIYRRFLESLYE